MRSLIWADWVSKHLRLIARYRKESRRVPLCDDQVSHGSWRTGWTTCGVGKTCAGHLGLLKEQDKLTEELEQQILAADTLPAWRTFTVRTS